ncbi:MAG: DNA polymerase I, partial [Defluviitaleaceae bacterium]|nr:DNA polymerase I [Defluviitaleaceae bacterium]
IGVTPLQYIDMKALMGDASDNIPGVTGIGEKTALKIIQEFGSVEAAIENATNIKPAKAAQNLAANTEIALLSKMLATIITDVPIGFNPQDATCDGFYNPNSREEIVRLGFKSYFERFATYSLEIESIPQDLPQAPKTAYSAIETPAALDAFVATLLPCPTAAFVSISADGHFAGVSISTGNHSAVFIKFSEGLPREAALSALAPFFSSDQPKIVADYKRELSILREQGIALQGVALDTSLAAYVIDSSKNSYSCADISLDFLNEPMETLDDFLGKGKARKKLCEIPQDQLLAAACRESNVLFRTAPLLSARIQENDQHNLLSEIELPLARVLHDMEIYGINVSKNELIQFGNKLDADIEGLTSEIYELAGEHFNINSPSQLGVILFEKLGLKGSKKTKSGYSTAAEVLEKLTTKHPIAGRVLKYRTYAKLKSTYVDGLLPLIRPTTGKLHSTFSQTITATGRISSSEPNLQNIPVRLELGRELRKAFIPSSADYVFLDGDYNQIELRVLAHLSGDETLIGAFNEDQDIHSLTASQVFGTPFSLVTPGQRSAAKAVNFGIVYGMGAYSLSQDLNISVKEAESYIAGYFERYPRVKQFMDETIERARILGYTTTLFERRRPIPELSSSNFNIRAFGERAAMNMPIQGTAADIIKIAMVRVHKRLTQEKFRSRLILQVHDELLLEAHREELEEVQQLLKTEMEGCAKLAVPLVCSFHTGESWYDAK